MRYIQTVGAAELWGISERSVRNYCAGNRVPGAVLEGKTWMIPWNAVKPERLNRHSDAFMKLSDVLKAQKETRHRGGIYYKVQMELTCNSNRMEGNRLSRELTRYIFETNSIGVSRAVLKVDDIVETVNHFSCVDLIIDNALYMPTVNFIKQLHAMLKNGTTDSRKSWYALGEYKKLSDDTDDWKTVLPENVAAEMRKLLLAYNSRKEKTLEELLAFHCSFEAIHPFQSGNGKVGRLILFKECLRNNIVPFVIIEEMRLPYLKGIQLWKKERSYFEELCLTAQKRFKSYMDTFGIAY